MEAGIAERRIGMSLERCPMWTWPDTVRGGLLVSHGPDQSARGERLSQRLGHRQRSTRIATTDSAYDIRRVPHNNTRYVKAAGSSPLLLLRRICAP
jgi:hypothetical protein